MIGVNPFATHGVAYLLKYLVDQMLTTKKQLAAAQRDSEKEQLQRKCDYLDGEIDRLVYELYGLTAEEIKVVESG